MYQLRSPDPRLSTWVEHYWFVTAEAGPVDLAVTVFVDGRADLIFNHGAPYTRAWLGEEPRPIRESNLDAQRTRPLRIVQRGEVWTSGVRFRLGGLAPFVHTPLRALTDRVVPIAEAFGPSMADLAGQLRGLGPDEQAALLDERLTERCSPAGQERFRATLALLEAKVGQLTVEAMARAGGVSARQIERDFHRHLGLAPKSLGRILRIQEGLRRMMRGPDLKLADLALDLGYFDQAHFIRDFRRMTGGLPRGYRGYYPPAAPTDFAPNLVVYQAP